MATEGEGHKDEEDGLSAPLRSHLLVESTSLADLKHPLRGSARLRFTCLSVSQRYLAVGINTGNVHIFDRNTHKHLQLIFPEVEPSGISHVQICPNEKLVAFCTQNGHVFVFEMNVDKRQRPEKLRTITEHLKSSVTWIQWDSTGSKIFTSDISGKVYVAGIPRIKNIVLAPVDVIMKLESPVIQMDYGDDKLLVSTMTRCYLCHTQKQQYSQIGTKPREGEYGACILKRKKTSSPHIYCARPGSRIWEVDIEGSVLCTHQFKQQLSISSTAVLNMGEREYAPFIENSKPQSLAFPRLKSLGNQHLVTWNTCNIYVFNPSKVKIVIWSRLHTDIHDIVTVGSDLYVFFIDGEMCKLQLFKIPQVLSLLLFKKNYDLAAEVCCQFEQQICKMQWRNHFTVLQLQELLEDLWQNKKTEKAEQIKSAIMNIENSEATDCQSESSDSLRSRTSSVASIRTDISTPVTIASHHHTESVPNVASDVSEQEIRTHPDVSKGHPIDIDLWNVSDLENSLEISNNAEDVLMAEEEKSLDVVSVDGTRTIPDADTCSITSAGELHRQVISNLTEIPEPMHVKTGDPSLIDDSIHDVAKLNDTNHDVPPVFANESLEPLVIAPKTRKPRASSVNLEDGKTKRKRGSRKSKSFQKLSNESSSTTVPIVKSTQKSTDINIYVDDIFEDSKNTFDKNNLTEISLKDDVKNADIRESKDDGTIDISSSPVLMTDGNILQTNQRDEKKLIPVPTSRKLHRVWSESDVATSTSHMTGSVDSDFSPSQSPLCQSWESTARETGGITKITMSTVKETLHSKFLSTKKKLLQTIKEKNRLTLISPSRDDYRSSEQRDTVDAPVTEFSNQSLIAPILVEDIVPKPPIDLCDLEASTKLTFSSVHRVEVILNPKCLRKTLEDWITVLHKTMQTFHVLQVKNKIKDYLHEQKKLTRDHHNLEKVEKTVENITEVKEKQHAENFEKQNENTQGNVVLNEKTEKEVQENSTEILPDSEGGENIPKVNNENGETEQKTFLGLLGENINMPAIEDLDDEELEKEEKKKEGDEVEKETKSTDKINLVNHDIATDMPAIDSEKSKLLPDEDASVTSDLPPLSSLIVTLRCDHLLHSTDPLLMPVDLQKQVRTLLNMCFSSNILGEVDSYIPSEIATYQGHKVYLKVDRSLSIHSKQADSPKTLHVLCGSEGTNKEMCDWIHVAESADIPENSMEENKGSTLPLLSLFVHGYSFLLDFHGLRTVISGLPLDDVPYVWISFVRALWGHFSGDIFMQKMKTGEINYALDFLTMEKHPDLKVLAYISRLFADHVTKGLAQCLTSTQLSPLDVYCMCSLEGLDMKNEFFSYMSTRINDRLSQLRLQGSECDWYGHPQMVCVWLDILLSLDSKNKIQDLMDSTGKPRQGSHRLPWKHKKLIDHCLQSAEKSQWQELLRLCNNYGYWNGSFNLLSDLKRTEDLLTLIMHLGDFDLLQEGKGYMPSEMEEWKFCVKHLSQKVSNDQINVKTCEETKDLPSSDVGATKDTDAGSLPSPASQLESLIMLMIRTVGPDSAVTILKSCKLPENTISPKVFRACLIGAYVDRQKRIVTNNMLEKLDAYLWSRKPQGMLPELQFAVQKEKQARSLNRQHSDSLSLDDSEDLYPQYHRYREETDCAWGVTTSLNRPCACCNLPLMETVSHTEPGVLIFQCGHVFHKYCVPARNCVLCQGSQSTDQSFTFV